MEPMLPEVATHCISFLIGSAVIALTFIALQIL